MCSAKNGQLSIRLPEQYKIEAFRDAAVVVLVSGGIESASLVYFLAQYFARVQPVYVRCGLAWEEAEYQALLNYLHAIKGSHVEPLKVFNMPLENVYDKHWSTNGGPVPDSSSSDAAVYLPGRNLLLLVQTGIWCSLQQIRFIALGCLGSNPFPDAGANFFHQLKNIFTMAMDFNMEIFLPFADMHKQEVIELSKNLPLHLTFSCINPILQAGTFLHCGSCNKCAERQKAFALAKVEDRTFYVCAP